MTNIDSSRLYILYINMYPVCVHTVHNHLLYDTLSTVSIFYPTVNSISCIFSLLNYNCHVFVLCFFVQPGSCLFVHVCLLESCYWCCVWALCTESHQKPMSDSSALIHLAIKADCFLWSVSECMNGCTVALFSVELIFLY